MTLRHIFAATSVALTSLTFALPVRSQDDTDRQDQRQQSTQRDQRRADQDSDATHHCDICGLTVTRTPGPSGLRVTSVEQGSPADEAGLQEGDLVMRVSQMDPDSPQDLSDWIQKRQRKNQSTDAQLRIRRNGRARLVTMNLPAEQDSSDQQARPRDGRNRDNDLQARQPDRDQTERRGSADRVLDGRFRSRERQLGERFGGRIGQDQQDIEAGLGVGIDESVRDGVVVRYLYEGSPAERAGIELEDRIVALNDQAIRTPGQLVDRIRTMDPRREAVLTVVREGEREQLDVVLGERSEILQGRIVASRGFRRMLRGRSDDRTLLNRPAVEAGDGELIRGLRDEIRELRNDLEDLRNQLNESRTSSRERSTSRTDDSQ